METLIFSDEMNTYFDFLYAILNSLQGSFQFKNQCFPLLL